MSRSLWWTSPEHVEMIAWASPGALVLPAYLWVDFATRRGVQHAGGEIIDILQF